MHHRHLGDVRLSYNKSWTLVLFLISMSMQGQDLVPRAYLITPTGSNAVILSYAWNSGEINFDPSVPVEDASGRFNASVLSYYHSFSLLGRSSNIVVSAPYVKGTLEGTVGGARASVSPSGMADYRIRISTNLYGGPAMKLNDFRQWREKRLIGASVTVLIPGGQYDPSTRNQYWYKPVGRQAGGRLDTEVAALGRGGLCRGLVIFRQLRILSR